MESDFVMNNDFYSDSWGVFGNHPLEGCSMHKRFLRSTSSTIDKTHNRSRAIVSDFHNLQFSLFNLVTKHRIINNSLSVFILRLSSRLVKSEKREAKNPMMGLASSFKIEKLTVECSSPDLDTSLKPSIALFQFPLSLSDELIDRLENITKIVSPPLTFLLCLRCYQFASLSEHQVVSSGGLFQSAIE